MISSVLNSRTKIILIVTICECYAGEGVTVDVGHCNIIEDSSVNFKLCNFTHGHLVVAKSDISVRIASSWHE